MAGRWRRLRWKPDTALCSLTLCCAGGQDEQRRGGKPGKRRKVPGMKSVASSASFADSVLVPTRSACYNRRALDGRHRSQFVPAILTPRSHLERLLIVGVDGLVAANLALCLSDRLQIQGLPLRRLSRNAVRPGTLCDAADPEALQRMVQGSQVQWIVYCGQAAEASWSKPQRPMPVDREVRMLRALAEAAEKVGAALTVLSSDNLFHGPQLWHAEDEADDGRRDTAAARRLEAAAEGSRALVVRTHAYGWSPAGAAPGLAEQIWQAVVAGQALALDPDRYASPILVSDLAEMLHQAWRQGLTGLYHLAGAERVSLPRFAVELAAAFGMRHFRPAVQRRRLRRPLAETALDCRRAQCVLQRPMPLLREGLARFAAQASNGYRARLRVGDSSPSLARAAG